VKNRRFPQIHPDAPPVPDGYVPSPGVEYGCGVAGGPSCYEPHPRHPATAAVGELAAAVTAIELRHGSRVAPPRPFDPDLSPGHPANRAAAGDRGLRYDPDRRCYVDADGCMIRDRFGQPY